jgi:putative NIF3 family GTP cyclohydrolase 1 type 2
MPRASLSLIVRWCDQTLRTAAITDYDGAHNGLQVDNDGNVRRIAAAVDASVSTIRLARAAHADLLVVHHGLFWGARHPWTGRNYALLRLLLESNLAVYSSHLPLDLHRTLGNNARLCAALGFKQLAPFFRHGRRADPSPRGAVRLPEDWSRHGRWGE